MVKCWQDIKVEIDQEIERIRLEPPDEIKKIFKYCIVESNAGSYGQAFTTMVFTEGDCRYLAFYGANNIVYLCDDPYFTIEQLKTLVRTFVPISAEFLGYCGLKKLWQFVQDIMACLDEIENKVELKELLSSLTLYVAFLNGWIQHYFPWNIGTLFPHRRAEEIKEMSSFIQA
mgnify:CR=1 FL=1